jgi:dipeptidyl aminopeptidase/acylaminoacyl peptidase
MPKSFPAALILAAMLVPDASARTPKRYTAEQFMNVKALTGISFSRSGQQLLFSSNETGIYNAFTVPAAGGTPKQLTRSASDSTFAVEYFRNDDRFLYTRNSGGNELDHLYVMNKDGKEVDLTPSEKGKAVYVSSNPDGKAFYFAWNKRDPKFFDLYKLHTGTLETELLFENTAGLQPAAISNDERWIALVKPNLTIDSDVVLFDRKTKQSKTITEHQGNVSNNPATFDPASRYLYYLTDKDHEFSYVARYELASGKVEPVEKSNWDIAFMYFSDKGKYRVVGKNVDAKTEINLTETATGKAVALPQTPAGEIRGVTFSPDETRMAFYVNGDRSPSALYLYDFRNRKLAKLVDSLNPEIDPEDLVDAHVVRYPSFDKLAIPALLYKPHEASKSNRLPAIVEVHGGPGGQSRHGYSAQMQFLANQGYVILRVNNRGSSGYGKTFFAADDRKHGREPLRDCIEAKKYLQSLEYVDPDRIAILGGSYGGYMTLAALAFHPREFKAGVDIFGVSNWVRTLKSTPPWWESFRKALFAELGNPETEEAMLREISPLFHADRIERPLLVIQGANDPRVLKAESDEIVEAVKKKGVPVEYVIFPDEGHGFTKKANQISASNAIAKFLATHLKGSGK